MSNRKEIKREVINLLYQYDIHNSTEKLVNAITDWACNHIDKKDNEAAKPKQRLFPELKRGDEIIC